MISSWHSYSLRIHRLSCFISGLAVSIEQVPRSSNIEMIEFNTLVFQILNMKNFYFRRWCWFEVVSWGIIIVNAKLNKQQKSNDSRLVRICGSKKSNNAYLEHRLNENKIIYSEIYQQKYFYVSNMLIIFN